MVANILVISDSLNNGGVQKSLIPLLNLLSKNEKYKISLLLIKKEGEMLSQVPNSIEVLETPEILVLGSMRKNKVMASLKLLNKYGNRSKWEFIKYLFWGILTRNMEKSRQKFGKYFFNSMPGREKHYDKVLVFQNGIGTYYAADKIQSDEKYVWIHSDYRVFKRDEKMDLEYFGEFTKIFSISKSCVEILKSTFPTLKTKIFEVPNLLPISDILNKSKEKIDFVISKEGVNIVSVSRIDENKGYDLAIPAIAKLVQEKKVYKWYIIGDGNYKNKLENLIRKYKLKDNVILTGTLKNPYPYIKQSDIFLHPSRFEGKSVVIEEAKILSKPIVVTNYPTVNDQIQHLKNGYIVEINSNSIYEGLKELIENVELREQLKVNLRNTIFTDNVEFKNLKALSIENF